MYNNSSKVNRIISMLLVFCMIITMLPKSIYAEEESSFFANVALQNVTEYYKNRQNGKISAPMEGVARFAVGYPFSVSAFSVSDFDYKMLEQEKYHFKFNSFEDRYGENSIELVEKSWFLSSGINVQTWLSQIILDIISVGGDPADFNGRNYVYSLMKYQSQGTKGLFSNKGKYTGSADGLAAIALDTYWGDNQWPLTDTNNGLGRAALVKAMLDNYKYTYTGAEGGKMDLSSFRKGNEWGLGQIAKQMTQEAIFYNIFWTSQGLSRYATINASTGSAITASAISKEISSAVSVANVQKKLEEIAKTLNNKKVMGQSFETIRKGQCELQAAYIMSLLSAGIKVEDKEWTELTKFQLENGSFKRKASDLITNGESTAMAAIALDYGKRVALGEDRTTCSAFGRLKNNKDITNIQQDINNVLEDQKLVNEKISNKTDFNSLLDAVKEACADTSYKSKISFFSKSPDGIIANNDIILPKDGEPDVLASLVVVIKHGSTMDVIETDSYFLKSEDTTFPFDNNNNLLQAFYASKNNNKGMDCAFEPTALLSYLGKAELAKIKNNITFYPVKTSDRNSTAESYYKLAANYYYPEALAIIDEIALGNNPRQYQRAAQGTGEISETDLIKELLLKQKEDGSFSINNYLYLDIYSALALEAYFNGNAWGNEKADTEYGRKGSIEYLLRLMLDCDGVENGRSFGKISDESMETWSEKQSYMTILLSRWLKDETVITVGDKTDTLKSFAQKEIDGLIKTLDAIYDGTFTNGKCGFNKITQYTKYISALVATGNKQKIIDKKIWDTLRNSRLRDGSYPAYLTNINNIITSKSYYDTYATANVAMAMGDYINNKAILSTICFDASVLSDEEAVANDLGSIKIPDTTINNLNLAKKGFYGSTIAWTSSNADIINPNTGIVKRPDIGQRNVPVKLTIAVTRNAVTKTQEFYIVVLANGSEVQEIVDADYNELELPIYITKSLALSPKGSYGSDIAWTSSNVAVITNDGNVTLSDTEAKVKLTATITYKDCSKVKEFEVIVSKKIDDNNVVEKAINQFREYYNTNRNLTGSYWNVFAAKSVLGDDFLKYNFNVYDVKSHRKSSAWQATDYAAIILQILSQGDNPYDYQGVNYVEQLLNWLDGGWGAYGNPTWALMALDAAAADFEGHNYQASDILGFYLAQLKDLQYGPDLAGWGLIPLSNHLNDNENFRDNKILPALEEFKLTLKSSQEKSGANKGLFNTGGVEGGILTLSNGCVVSGFYALKAEGLAGYDLADDYWKVDGTGVLEAIYNIDVDGKKNISTQEIIEFGDVYYGDSVWKRVGIKKTQFIELIDDAKAIIDNQKEAYTSESYNALLKAYENAIQAKNNAEKMQKNYYGPSYFGLKASISALKPVGKISVKIIGDKATVLDTVTVDADGCVLDVLEKAVNDNKMIISIIDNKIIDIDGVVAGENEAWYCYEKTAEGIKRITKPFNEYNIKEGAELTFKHCNDIEAYKDITSLQQHLIRDAKKQLQIKGSIDNNNNVTGDLILTNTGLFGTTISWKSSKVLVIDENGRVNRDAREDIKVNLLAKIYLDGVEEEASFDVIVKATSNNNPNPPGPGPSQPNNKYAYIRVVGPVGTGIVFFEKQAIAIEAGETAFSLLQKTGLPINYDSNTQYGVYVRGIAGLNEFDEGKDSGWLYRVNSVFPNYSSALAPVFENDYVEWLYTRDLGKDVGGYVEGVQNSNSSSSSSSSSTTPIIDMTIMGDECIISPTATVINGEAVIAITRDSFKKILENVKANNSTAIVIDTTLTESLNKLAVKIERESLEGIADIQNISIILKTSLGTIALSKEALIDISKQLGLTVTISTEKKEDGSLDIAIKVGNSAMKSINNGILVKIPCNNANNSIVMTIINDDGTSKLIKKSITSENGTYARLEGSATIKVVDNTKKFEDVKKDSWYNSAVEFVSSHELFGGTSKNSFSPNEPMTRAMLVTVLHRLEDTPDGEISSFIDVQEDKYYANAVGWASNKDIVAGTGDGFNPDGEITREQLATIIYRYAQKLGLDTSTGNGINTAKDKESISNWAADAISWCMENEILTGKGDGIIDPKKVATRVEVAVILERFIQKLFK